MLLKLHLLLMSPPRYLLHPTPFPVKLPHLNASIEVTVISEAVGMNVVARTMALLLLGIIVTLPNMCQCAITHALLLSNDLHNYRSYLAPPSAMFA